MCAAADRVASCSLGQKILPMRFFNLFLLFIASGSLFAAKEPKGVVNAKKSLVTILVYDDGVLLRNGLGVFVGDRGDVLSAYSLFQGADSAVCVDASGRVRPIERIVGADDVYDCIKVRAAWDKKIKPLRMAADAAVKGAALYMVASASKKSAPSEQLIVSDVTTASGTAYYTLDKPLDSLYQAAPVVSEAGELVALVQPSAAGDTISSYAIAASFVDALSTSSLTYNSTLYDNIDIRRALPPTQKEALTTLYLLQGLSMGEDKARFFAPLNDYVSEYPQSYEGHLMLAEYFAIADSAFDKARTHWDKALRLSDRPDDVFFNISKVYTGAVARHAGDNDSVAVLFIDSALVNVDRAIAIKCEPLYLHNKAELHFAKGNFAEAFDCYEALSHTSMSSAEVYAAASKCKEALGEYDAAVAQMDSAVATFGTLPVEAMAPYLLSRAMLKHKAGRAREAVLDFNGYERLREGRLAAPFYYMREQAEYDAKMFQQALNDIDIAIYMQPQEPLYYIEKARLCYRVKLVDEALSALSVAAGLVPENPDVHYLVGRCHQSKGDDAKAKEAFIKAKEYGHPDAEARLGDIDKQK